MLVSQPVAQSPTAGRSVADGTLAAASGGVGLLGGHSGHPVAGCAHRVVSRGGRRILLSEPRRQRGGLAPHPVPPRGCSPGAFSPSAPRWAGGRRARVLAPPPHSGSHFRVPKVLGSSPALSLSVPGRRQPCERPGAALPPPEAECHLPPSPGHSRAPWREWADALKGGQGLSSPPQCPHL